MPFDYAQRISELSRDQRIEFYELFSHNLTCSVRGVWSDSVLEAAEKIERMKWLNELQHRVTAKIRVTRLNTHEWKESDLWGTIMGFTKLCPALRAAIAFDVEQSYNLVTKPEVTITIRDVVEAMRRWEAEQPAD